jgi:hypothetical protein
MKSMKNISFFGASVTKQHDGYVDYFKQKKEIVENYNVQKHGYGSMHLKDAGIIYIDKALSSSPSYCFLDWFNSWHIPDKQELYEYLNTILYKTSTSNCLPIFLLLSGADVMSKRRFNLYENVKEYCLNYNLPIINVHEKTLERNYTHSSIIRDSVHTNSLGSQVYADIIYDFFIKNIVEKYEYPLNPDLEFPISSQGLPIGPNKFCDIKLIPLNCNIKKEIKIKGEGKLLGIHQRIGPFSGLVEIKTNGKKTLFNLWDVWCHYERDNIKLSCDFSGDIVITVLDIDFDKSKAKQQLEWNSYEKEIRAYELYYIGNIDSISYE